MSGTIIIVSIIVGIIASLITIWLFLSQQISRFLGRIILQLINSAVPIEPVRIVPHQQTCKWGKSENAEKANMRVGGTWYVTNIAETPARIINSRIMRPRPARVLGNFHVFYTQEDSSKLVGGSGIETNIPPGITARCQCSFLISKLIRKDGKDFKATVVFTDHLGNEYKQKITFKYEPPARRGDA